MDRNDKRLIVPFTVFWTLIVSMFMLSAQRNLDAVAENKQEMTITIDDCDAIQRPLVSPKVKYHRTVGVSNEGIKHIKAYESLRLTPYTLTDSSRYNIGYGHVIKNSDPLWVKEIVAKYRITKADADKILRYDIEKIVNPAINRMFNELESEGVNTQLLSQGFIDGLGSLIYNCGEGGVRKTEFYRLLKNGKIEQAIAKVEMTHVYMRGHYSRRLAEAEMMRG